MKIKFTIFILMLILITATIGCTVDAGGTPPAGNCSVCPQTYRYTDEQQRQIRQNLIGVYQLERDSVVNILDIRSHNHIIENEAIQYPYVIVFSDPPLLIIRDEEFESLLEIQFRPNNPVEVIGLSSEGVDGSLLYYSRVENHQAPPHDEL